jgi:eukaryotic-like serine/threonine-protein kinase
VERAWYVVFCVATDLVPGAIVAGRYRLDRLLGEGGMGVVWAATHVATDDKPVALKLLRPGATDDLSTRRRFLREARAAAAVNHPNVLEIQEAVELEDGTPVLVMDLLRGESLRARLVRDGRIPLAELSRLLLPVISAVGTAHARGIIHRDLKPDNIFLVALGEGDEGTFVKVLDFGIAKLTATEGEASSNAGLTDTGALLGTPYYMSPEQILGEHDIDHRADIWSLGVILYECLTAVRPTEADSVGKVLKRILTGAIRPIGEISPDLPADAAAIIDRMLCPARGKRPTDLLEVGTLLDRYAGMGFRPFGPPAAPVSFDSRSSCIPPNPCALAAAATAFAGALDGEAQLATLPAGSVPPPQAVTGRPPAPGAAANPSAAPTAPPGTRARWTAAAVTGLLLAGMAAFFLVRRDPDRASASTPPPAPSSPPGAPSACPDGMAFIRGGVFRMGSEDGKVDERPIHPVEVADFCLDRLEVTVDDYGGCVREQRCKPPATTVVWQGIAEATRQFESQFCHAYQSDRRDHPINCVSFREADGYCRAVGKRLPSEQEWEYAATAGGKQRPYAWGAAAPGPTLLNVCGAECASYYERLGKTIKPLYDGADPFPTTAPVGRFPAGDAPSGVHDLAGNVWEWTASAYCPYPDHTCESPYRVFRGGGWISNFAVNLRSTNRLWSSPDHRYIDVGVRCAAEAMKPLAR